MQILLLTENAETRNTVSDILSTENIPTVITDAEYDENPLDLLSQTHYDIVVLDATRTDCNCFELLQKIKMRHPSTPVLILSLNNTRAFALQAMRLNAQGFLTNDRIVSEFADAVKSIRLGRCYMTTELTA